MKIRSLKLKNFRSHAATELLDMQKVTVIRGDLNQGKSSIEMAIEVALTGRCEATDDKGVGQTDLIRDGQPNGAEVLLELGSGESFVEVRCGITEKSGRAVSIRKPGVKDYDPTALGDYLRRNRDILNCLCNNRFFVTRDPKEQKRILASIIIPDNYNWPDAILDDADGADLTIPWVDPPFTVIEAAYEKAFSARTAVNREIKAWQQPPAPAEDALTIEAARKNLSDAQKAATDAQRAREGLLHAYSLGKSLYEGQLKVIQQMRASLSAEEQELVGLTILSEDVVKKLKKTAGEAERAGILDGAIASANEKIVAIKEQIDTLERLDGASCCPTCKQAITEEVMTGLLKPFIKANDRAIQQHREAVAARKEIGDFEAAKTKLAAHTNAVKDQRRIQAKVEQLRKQIETAEFELVNPSEAPDTGSADRAIAQACEDLDAAQNALVAASEAENQKSNRSTALARKEILDTQLQRLERLVAYFGPDGVKAQLIAEHVGGFVDKMNEVLDAWRYSCALSLEPYGFLVTKYYMEEVDSIRHLHLMSKSEQYRFAIAFQYALAVVSDIRFCVVDESEVLTPGTRGSMLMQFADSPDIDQVIVIGTDDRREVPDLANASFFYLSDEDGKGTKVETLRAEVTA